jgi:hypothetical protein
MVQARGYVPDMFATGSDADVTMQLTSRSRAFIKLSREAEISAAARPSAAVA